MINPATTAMPRVRPASIHNVSPMGWPTPMPRLTETDMTSTGDPQEPPANTAE